MKTTNLFHVNSLARARILNVYGAQESIPRNQFRQTMYPGGPVRQPYAYSVPGPHRLFFFLIPAQKKEAAI
jgi:hypothetical protein